MTPRVPPGQPDSTGFKGRSQGSWALPAPSAHLAPGNGAWAHHGQRQGLGSSWPSGLSGQLCARLPGTHRSEREARGWNLFLAGSLFPLLRAQIAEARVGFPVLSELLGLSSMTNNPTKDTFREPFRSRGLSCIVIFF